MSKSVPHRLGQVLLSQGRINQAQLEAALVLQQSSHQPLGEALMTLGYLTQAELKGALKKQVSLRTTAFYLAAALTPLSMNSVAEDVRYQDEHKTYITQYYQHLTDKTSKQEWLTTAAKAVWNLYQNTASQQTESSLTYSISHNPEVDSYQIELNYRY